MLATINPKNAEPASHGSRRSTFRWQIFGMRGYSYNLSCRPPCFAETELAIEATLEKITA